LVTSVGRVDALLHSVLAGHMSNMTSTWRSEHSFGFPNLKAALSLVVAIVKIILDFLTPFLYGVPV